MTLHDNAYAAFMLDYAAGVLSPAERLAADLHRALSHDGSRNGRMVDAVGGALLEKSRPAPAGYFDTVRLEGEGQGEAGPSPLDPYLKRDLLGLPWRRNFFGVKTLPTDTPLARLLRLDPNERAPAHGHGRRDVTVVLCGSFADQFGVYERGDLAFAEPGVIHRPRAVGGESCICLLATESGRPFRGFFGQFNISGRPSRKRP